MKVQASARPMPKCRRSGGDSVRAGTATGATVAGVVVVVIVFSSGQVGRLGPGEPVLDERDDHEDGQQRYRHGRRAAEVEAAEGDAVDVVLEPPGRVDRTTPGRDRDGVEHLERADH